jgi:hypothetical protein
MNKAFPERETMEILYNPNIAYVLLVVGFVLALLAIVAPGTGMLEVGAFFLLALAGFAIYHIGFDLWALIVLLMGAGSEHSGCDSRIALSISIQGFSSSSKPDPGCAGLIARCWFSLVDHP